MTKARAAASPVEADLTADAAQDDDPRQVQLADLRGRVDTALSALSQTDGPITGATVAAAVSAAISTAFRCAMGIEEHPLPDAYEVYGETGHPADPDEAGPAVEEPAEAAGDSGGDAA